MIRKKMILGFDDLRSWRFAFMTVCVPGGLRFFRFRVPGGVPIIYICGTVSNSEESTENGSL